MTVAIRPATESDCQQIADIYRHYVQTTVITFDYESLSADEWNTKRCNIIDRHRPFIVATEGETVLGFAYLADFRPKMAYDWTVEDTIYLHPEATGRGLGSTLLRELLSDLDPTSVRQVVAVIAESPASIALHKRFGFVQTGTLCRIGYKFDRWVDCAVLQFEVPFP